MRAPFHIALASFVLQAIGWAGTPRTLWPTSRCSTCSLKPVADWLLGAATLWFVYLALEPEVRSRWPHSIVTWNRLLAGKWLDAQVGSQILIGAALGSGVMGLLQRGGCICSREP